MGGGWSSLSAAPTNPSLVGDKVLVQGEDVEDAMATRAVLGADDMGRHSSEGFGGKGGDLLWLPIVCMETKCPASSAPRLEGSETVEAEAARGHDVGDVGAAAAIGEASSTFGLVVSSAISPVSAPPAVSYEGGHIAPPFMERSTRCVTLLLFLFQLGLLTFFL